MRNLSKAALAASFAVLSDGDHPRPLVQLYEAVCKAAYNYKNSNGVVAPTNYTIKPPLPLKVAFAKAAGLPYEGPFVSLPPALLQLLKPISNAARCHCVTHAF